MLAVVAGLLVACGTTAPSPVPTASPTTAPTASPSPSASLDPEALYTMIESQVVAIRGLQPDGPVARQVIDEPALVELITEGFNKDNPADYVAAYGRLLQHMALLPADEDLGKLYLELLGSQVIGLYDTDTQRLYVVIRGGGVGPTAKITFAHEYTHALQDQRFDLDALQPLDLDEGDQTIARTSVAEGDATLLMSLWAQQNMTPEEFQVVIQESSDPEALAILGRMPAILRESLEFPYGAGLTFVGSIWQSAGWEGINGIYDAPPSTTEAILHPEKYIAGEAAVDVTVEDGVALRLGDGWSETLQDTLGEFQIGVWLREAGEVANAAATDAAAGWGGDRLAMYEGPEGAWAFVVETAWDTEDDASEFVTGAQGIVGTLDETASADVLQRDPSQATIVVGSDDAVLGRLANALGLAG